MRHWSAEDRIKWKTAKLMQTPVAEMGLPVRIVNALEDRSIILVDSLLAQSYEDLMAIKNFGTKALAQVKAAIRRLGLPLPAWRKPRNASPPPTNKDIFSMW
jgi:DNA-directed RNA polymerase alpha subunit